MSFVGLVLLGQEVAYAKAPAHFLNASLRYRLRPNDDPGTLSFLPVPILFYRNNGAIHPDLGINILTGAGLFNVLSMDYKLSPRWSFFTSFNTLLLFAGDSPKVDGEDFDGLYEFDAHRFRSETGFVYHTGPRVLDLSIRPAYEAQYRMIYNQPASVTFTSPESFLTHGPSLTVESSKRPASELQDFGFRPTMYAGYFFRQGNDAWGPLSFRRDIDHYFAGSLSLRHSQKLSSRFVLVGQADGAIVHKADRLNAISDGNLKSAVRGKFLGNVKADRSVSGELGLRTYLEPRGRIALKPYAYTAGYRELSPLGPRKQFAYGGGLSLYGMSWQRFLWEFSYGAIEGVDEDKIIHEVQAFLTYRILP